MKTKRASGREEASPAMRFNGDEDQRRRPPRLLALFAFLLFCARRDLVF
jgi:hypothetical protein